MSIQIMENKIQRIYTISFLVFFYCQISNIVNKNIFAWLFIYFNIIWIKSFYIDNIIEKLVRSVYIHYFNFVPYFQLILLIKTCLNFVSWNGNGYFCFAWYFIRYQCTLTAINNAMVTTKKTSKIYKFHAWKVILFH